MKKLLTLTAAVLASLTMMAQTTLATFEVNLAAAPTAPYASYSDDDATYTCNKVGSSSTSNYYKASSGKYYLKLTGNDAYIQIKLKSGSFAADDTVFYALNHTDKKTGIGFIFSKSSATTTVDMTASATEVIGKYALKATDIEDDGSIKMLRANSNTFVNRIYVVSPAAIVDPVASVTIAGPTRGTKDYASTFSATTDVKADAYQWFVNDVEQTGATAKTFEFTPTAAGDYSIVCKARNANNATDEWIASSSIAFKALNSLSGEIIKAVHTGSTTADVSGLIGGTADKSTESGGKINSGGYFGIKLASGNFQEGDTLNVNITTKSTSGSAVLIIYSEKTAENIILNTEEVGVVGDNKFVLPAAVNNKNALYIVRTEANGWNAVVNSISVVRPMATKSVVESLTGLSIDGEALDAASLAALQSAHNFGTAVQYVNAPTMVFTKHVVITYEDDSQVESDKEIEVLATDLGDFFEARATINSIEYIINTEKATSFVVTYMDGTTELGTENVATGSAPANYADFQNKSLATFGGWYSDPELENAVADMSAEVITAAKTYYAKFEDAYATSINFEKAVMQNSKKYGIIAQLGAQHFATNITGSLDSLDNSKADKLRNYAYLGLKVKQAGAMLDFRLAAGNTVKIKFGNIATTPQVSIDGGAYADMTITDKVYAHTATANEIISIKMANGNAVVFQQIMIDEELQAPELFAINCAEAENGTVAAPYKLGIPDESVTLTVTPASGYKVEDVQVNGASLNAVESVYSFLMPAEDVTVSASFVEDSGTAIDNTDAAVKATKVLRDGQVLILRDGKFFNALGVEVK